MKKRTRYSPTIYQITFFIRKAKKEGLTESEAQTLHEWLDQDVKNLELYNRLLTEDHSHKIEDMLAKDTSGWYSRTKNRTAGRKTIRWISYGSLLAAASVALYFLFTPRITVDPENNIQTIRDATEVVTLSSGDIREDLLVHADSIYVVSSLLKEIPTESRIADKYEEPIIISTPVGKTIAFKLDDGSTVYLNSNSNISFYRDFDLEEERRVSLNGEAFFEVARDIERPFIVENNDNEIKVLGTSFNVNGYDTRSKFKLGLATGKVEVNIKEIGYSKILTPGYEVTYDKTINKVVQNTKDIHQIGLWRTGVYLFEDISILELTKDMEQLYPIHFVYEGKMPKHLFSGEISRNEDWEKVLSKLEMTNRVRFIVEGNQITVKTIEVL